MSGKIPLEAWLERGVLSPQTDAEVGALVGRDNREEALPFQRPFPTPKPLTWASISSSQGGL